MRIILIFFLLSVQVEVSAQLERLVEPVIEYANFNFNPERSSDLIVVNNRNREGGILWKDGTVLVAPGTLKAVNVHNENGVISGIDKTGKYVAYNKYGKIISEGYDRLNMAHRTNIISVEKNKLFGLMDTNGKVIRPTVYKNLSRKERGVYIGELPDGSKENIIVDESDGKTNELRKKLHNHKNAVMKDRIVFTKKFKPRGSLISGIINMEGDTLMQPTVYCRNGLATHFEGQVFAATDVETQLAGVIDKDGHAIIPFENKAIGNKFVNNEYFIVNNSPEYALYDFRGEKRASLTADAVYPLGPYPYVKTVINEKYFLMNLDLKKVTNVAYDKIGDERGNGYVVLRKNGLKGFFSLKSGKHTPPKFEKLGYALGFGLGLCVIKENELYGLYDIHKGEMVFETNYTRVSRNGKFIHTIQKEMKDDLTEKGENFHAFYDDSLRLVYGPTKKSLIILRNEIFVDKINADSTVLHNINTGELLTVLGDIKFGNEFVTVKEKGKCFFDEFFQPNCRYFDFISPETEGLRIFKKNGKVGLLHNKEIVEPAIYETVRDIKNGLIWVKLGGKWGVLKNPYFES